MVGIIISKGMGNVNTKGMRNKCFIVFLFRLGDIELPTGKFMLRNRYASLVCLDSQEQAAQLTITIQEETQIRT